MSDVEKMMDAIRQGDLHTVVALITSGADVNALDGLHWPPLFQAIEHQQIEIVRRLIEAGADVNWDVGQGWTPLVHAIDIESDAAHQAESLPSTELVELLLSSGAIPTEQAYGLAMAYNNHKAQSLLETVIQDKPI